MRPVARRVVESELSRQVDGPARMAYAHLPIERARQFIQIGTTNSKNYLADPTGARRFWPSKSASSTSHGLPSTAISYGLKRCTVKRLAKAIACLSIYGRLLASSKKNVVKLTRGKA
jgi:hypothetical protein